LFFQLKVLLAITISRGYNQRCMVIDYALQFYKTKGKQMKIRFTLPGFLLIVSFCLAPSAESSAQATLAEQITADLRSRIPDSTRQPVAIFDLTDISGDTLAEGQVLAQQISAELNSAGVGLVERQNLQSVIEEQKLSMTGLADEELQVGNLLNAKTLITGNIAHLDEQEDVYIKMTDTQSGEIYGAFNYSNNLQKRRSEIAAGKDPHKERVLAEFDRREAFRKSNPEGFKALLNYKSELLLLKKKNPERYQEILRTLGIVEKLRRQNPKLFLVVTSPEKPQQGRRVGDRIKEEPEVQSLRENLAFIVKHAPAYREVLKSQRQEIQQNNLNAGHDRFRRR